jgi:hypothetical protein
MNRQDFPTFDSYIGIDYSGAKTPIASLPGLRIFRASRTSQISEVEPPPGRRKYWTRRGVAEWLVEELSGNQALLIGIDHGFSFPIKYFNFHGIPRDWTTFHDDFHSYWPTDGDKVTVASILESSPKSGDAGWKRITENRTEIANSVFNFAAKQGNVAYSTHAGLPWLRYIRQKVGNRVHFWPFDGWDFPVGKSVVAEVYPTLWSDQFRRPKDRSDDQHDAYSVAAWMRRADLDGCLASYFKPDLSLEEREVGEIEGWILGVV